MKNLLSFVALVLVSLLTCEAACPCKSEELCKPVTKKYTKELVVFDCASDPHEWKSYNWSEITHIIICGDNVNVTELYCHAHQNEVRVTSLVGLS